MYKVKQLYVIFDDDNGHKYLIPKDEYGTFDECRSLPDRQLRNYDLLVVHCTQGSLPDRQLRNFKLS